MQTSSAFRTVRCSGCGAPRQVTARQARRADLCKTCLHPPRIEVTDRHRRFWLAKHTDQELAVIATDMLGRPVPAEVFALHRESLTVRTTRV